MMETVLAEQYTWLGFLVLTDYIQLVVTDESRTTEW